MDAENPRDTTQRALDAGIVLVQVARSAGSGWKKDPHEQLAEVRLVELAAEQLRRALVIDMRDQGITWSAIGDTLGTTRQAVQQRYGQ